MEYLRKMRKNQPSEPLHLYAHDPRSRNPGSSHAIDIHEVISIVPDFPDWTGCQDKRCLPYSRAGTLLALPLAVSLHIAKTKRYSDVVYYPFCF